MSSTHCPLLESLACANPDCVLYTQVGQSNLTDLEIYSRLLDWEKRPILIFYEDAIATTQVFSQTFLDALTRFDATICRLITDSSHPIIPPFSPQDPHLIQSILTWLQPTLLQN